MRRFWLFISLIGLILTLGPSLLVFAGRLTWQIHALLMAIGMVLWFVSTPLALRRPVSRDEEKIE
ncbi:MAG: hypothetical protein ACERK6_08350 [Candidatus Aminicenantaceae bacterium]